MLLDKLLHALDLLCVVPSSEERDVPSRVDFVSLTKFPCPFLFPSVLVKNEFEKSSQKNKRKKRKKRVSLFCFFFWGGGLGERNENRVKTFGSKKKSGKGQNI